MSKALTRVILNKPIGMKSIRLVNSACKARMSTRNKPTYAVLLERGPAVLLMAYGGLSRSSPAWLGVSRFAWAALPSPKIGAVGLGGGEVREGGTLSATAWAKGSSQGYTQN